MAVFTLKAKQNSLKQLEKRFKEKPATQHYDNLDHICQRFMMWIRKDYPGQKSEISPKELTKRAKKWAIAFGMSDSDLIDALLRRKWVEPEAGDIWHLRYDKAGL